MTSEQLVERLGEFFTTEPAGEGPERAISLWDEIEVEGEQGTLGLFTAEDQKWTLARITDAGREKMAQLSDDVPGMAYRLHPTILDDLGLAPPVRVLADDFTKRGDIEIGLRERNFPRALSREPASCLYRVVQESLNNIVKHAKATQVQVFLNAKPDRVTMEIEDNGRG